MSCEYHTFRWWPPLHPSRSTRHPPTSIPPPSVLHPPPPHRPPTPTLHTPPHHPPIHHVNLSPLLSSLPHPPAPHFLPKPHPLTPLCMALRCMLLPTLSMSSSRCRATHSLIAAIHDPCLRSRIVRPAAPCLPSERATAAAERATAAETATRSFTCAEEFSARHSWLTTLRHSPRPASSSYQPPL